IFFMCFLFCCFGWLVVCLFVWLVGCLLLIGFFYSRGETMTAVSAHLCRLSHCACVCVCVCVCVCCSKQALVYNCVGCGAFHLQRVRKGMSQGKKGDAHSLS